MSGKANLYNSCGMAVIPRLFNPSGGFNKKKNLDKINENIRIALMTEKGTLIGDPLFGSNLYKILGYGKTTATASMIRTEIQAVMSDRFPELSLNKIDIDFDDRGVISIYIVYSIEYSNVNSNVTLEFIKNEGGYTYG